MWSYGLVALTLSSKKGTGARFEPSILWFASQPLQEGGREQAAEILKELGFTCSTAVSLLCLHDMANSSDCEGRKSVFTATAGQKIVNASFERFGLV